jgi:flagellar hook-associated protein 1
MSLFATIQTSANALQVSELGLQVVSNNVANANTPGYIRQDLVQSTGPAVLVGGVLLGYGVKANGVVQKFDDFTASQLRDTLSNLESSKTLDDLYSQIESVFGELSDTDLSSKLSDFSGSIQDVLNQPANTSLRRLVIERAKSLATDIRGINTKLVGLQDTLNQGVRESATEINRLTEGIAKLNTRIVEIEGGGSIKSDAVGLRDEREQLLNSLAQIVDIRASEQQSGSITVFVGGEYLVSDGIQRKVTVNVEQRETDSVLEIRLADTDSPLQVSSGRLKGYYDARDKAAGTAFNDINQFARDLIEQFNLIHSQGQGLAGFSSVTGTNAADDATAAVDLAGLPINIKNGEFEVQVSDSLSGLTKTHVIRVQLNGGTGDSSLADITSSLNSLAGISASLTPEGKLRIESDSDKITFAFQNDTTNFLAAAGINTFFEGDSAASIAVNSIVADDPRMFAASLTGVGGGTDNALKLAQAFDEPLEQLDGRSIKQSYEDLVVRTTQDINVQSGVTDGLQNYYKVLEGKLLGITGVNLDEEAVKMIFYQRAFQASSRVIQASSELLDTLMSL